MSKVLNRANSDLRIDTLLYNNRSVVEFHLINRVTPSYRGKKRKMKKIQKTYCCCTCLLYKEDSWLFKGSHYVHEALLMSSRCTTQLPTNSTIFTIMAICHFCFCTFFQGCNRKGSGEITSNERGFNNSRSCVTVLCNIRQQLCC